MATALLDLFLELCAIPSPPGEERAVADRVLAELRATRARRRRGRRRRRDRLDDGQPARRLPATRGAGGTPIFLCAHLDTVPPSGAIEPVVEDGVVRNGARHDPRRRQQVGGRRRWSRRPGGSSTRTARTPASSSLFTPKEEVGLPGAYAFDHDAARRAASATSTTRRRRSARSILGAPYRPRARGPLPRARRALPAWIRRRAARRSPPRRAPIADLRLGRIDEETTANVGLIQGGTARNIVPERCVVEAEARSHDDAQARATSSRRCSRPSPSRRALADCTRRDARCARPYRGYRFRADDRRCASPPTALASAGYEPRYALSGGGADANVFNERGLPCVNLANGMAEIHTPDEHIAVADLEAMVEVTLALVEARSRCRLASAAAASRPSLERRRRARAARGRRRAVRRVPAADRAGRGSATRCS